MRVNCSGTANPSSAAVEVHSATNKVKRHRTEEAVDGVGSSRHFRPRTGRQKTETQFAKHRQAPFVIRDCGSRFAFRKIRNTRAKLRPVLTQHFRLQSTIHDKEFLYLFTASL